MTAREYQNKVAKILKTIFSKELVKTEWNSVEFDEHAGNHKLIYAPRHDIAIGPFNSYLRNLDTSNDCTEIMMSHLLTTKLFKNCLKNRGTLKEVWNNFNRCYLAIELEFSGSSKHMLGSIINASVSGGIGIIITTKKNIKKINRLVAYIMRLEGLERIEINHLRNLIVFEKNDFLKLLSDVKKKVINKK